LTDPEVPDDALVAVWRGGDDRAFSTLVDRHGPAVLGFLYSYVRDPRLAEDAWSETFLRAVRARDRYKPDGKFRGWLFTIARRCGKDVLRSRRRWFGLALRVYENPERTPLLSPESELMASEEQRRLSAAMAQLPDKHRVVIVLTYQHGLDSAEAAEILGLTSQQVRSRVTYARRLLADLLQAP
jgi:RNA polymerase sigma-70 factor (ECF subfamily)